MHIILGFWTQKQIHVASCAPTRNIARIKLHCLNTRFSAAWDFIHFVFILYTRSRNNYLWLARDSASPLEPCPKHAFCCSFAESEKLLWRVAVNFGCTMKSVKGFELPGQSFYSFTKCVLYMYNMLYTIFVLLQTSVSHYDSQVQPRNQSHKR